MTRTCTKQRRAPETAVGADATLPASGTSCSGTSALPGLRSVVGAAAPGCRALQPLVRLTKGISALASLQSPRLNRCPGDRPPAVGDGDATEQKRLERTADFTLGASVRRSWLPETPPGLGIPREDPRAPPVVTLGAGTERRERTQSTSRHEMKSGDTQHR